MSSILITAFEPYDIWKTNASWLTLVELTRCLPASSDVTTRLYPVHYGSLRERLARDLQGDYDIVFHLGQSPGATGLLFESVALNVACERLEGEAWPLAEAGPVAYRSRLPLGEYVAALRSAGIPANISYHAGTYLCNAAMYWTHYLSEQKGYRTRATMVHLPLDSHQAVDHASKLPSLPATLMAQALRQILLANHSNGGQ